MREEGWLNAEGRKVFARNEDYVRPLQFYLGWLDYIAEQPADITANSYVQGLLFCLLVLRALTTNQEQLVLHGDSPPIYRPPFFVFS